MKKRRGVLLSVVAVCAMSVNAGGATGGGSDPTVGYGAQVYRDRCILCHGRAGYGDGALALALKESYPNTNLHKNKYGDDKQVIRRSIIYGGSRGRMSNEMPPWGDELTYVELESVALFSHLLIRDPQGARKILDSLPPREATSAKAGRILFRNYCALCHGEFGEGNGRMAQIIKNPPPFNLTRSGVPAQYVKAMITKGGEAMGRSARMPPFADQLSQGEIESLVEYVLSLRRH